jgi:periplasmic divalent cation tolerance protein
MTDFLWVYSTHKNKSEALQMAKTLSKEKLIACANIIDQVTSVYEWNGEICEENEVIIIMKTSKSHFENLKKRIEEIHSYDCPCIIALPIKDGNQDYLSWLNQATTL